MSLFVSKISSTIYYKDLTEAITTFIVMSAAAIICIVLFLHTMYKFFCEQIPLNDGIAHKKQTPSTGIGSTPNVGRIRSNSSTRARVPSMTKHKQYGTRSRGGSSSLNKPAHKKEISFIIAALTLLYLLFASVYTTTNSIIRLLTIFIGYDIDCYVFAYVQVFIVFIKLSFYLLFLTRLHLTFHSTGLAVKQCLLVVIGIVSVVLLLTAFIWFLLYLKSQLYSVGGNCNNNNSINYTYAVLPGVIIDTIISVVLLYLFIKKLSDLIRSQTSSLSSLLEINKSDLERIKKLISVMTKLTVLVCVYQIASWLILLLFLPILPGASAMIDIIVGSFAVIFCYEFHQSNYDRYCFPCKYICFNVCFWWFITCNLFMNNNNNNDDDDCNIDDDDELGCYDVCCLNIKSNQIKTPKTNMKRSSKNSKDEMMLSATLELEQKPVAKQNAIDVERKKIKNKPSAIEKLMMHDIDVQIPDDIKQNDMDNNDDADDDDDDNFGKRGTMIINLNAADKNPIIDLNDEVIKRQETSVACRAVRLREMQELFFNDHKKTKKRYKVKKKNNKNIWRVGKRNQTDFAIHKQKEEEEDENDNKKVGHVIKKSRTTL